VQRALRQRRERHPDRQRLVRRLERLVRRLGRGVYGQGTNPTCTVTMTGSQSVSATFIALPTYTLTVTPGGAGTGLITSSVGGISCPGTCTSTPLVSGTPVSLTAIPASSSSFTGWSGACSGSSTICNLTNDGSQHRDRHGGCGEQSRRRRRESRGDPGVRGELC